MIIHPHQNPIDIARRAQEMADKAKGADGLAFQKIAMVTMCVVAASSAAQVLLSLIRETHHKDSHDYHGR